MPYADPRIRRIYAAVRFANYTSRHSGTGELITLADALAVLPLGVRCTYCKLDHQVGLDHIVPTSRGGSNTRANLQPCCAPCNSRKSNRGAPGVRAFR